MTNSNTTPARRTTTSSPSLRIVILLLVAFAASGCANGQEGVKTTINKLTSGVSSGVQRLQSKGPSKKSRKANNAAAIVAKYPTNEIPHTLMRKPVAEGRLTSGHGYRLSPTGVPIPRKHKGVDYAAPNGTKIFAAGDGTINKLYKSKSYGNYISIEHANNFVTAYAHMKDFASGLEVGSEVKRGQLIGYVGSTGRSSGDHLHFELIHRGKYIDPLFETVVQKEPPVQIEKSEQVEQAANTE